jgi:hypothetical protein
MRIRRSVLGARRSVGRAAPLIAGCAFAFACLPGQALADHTGGAP